MTASFAGLAPRALGGAEFLNEWVLKIELNGEWEECRFPTRSEALSAFLALAADYCLKRAILLRPRAAFAGSGSLAEPGLLWLN